MADIQCNTCGITRNTDLATQIGDKYFCSPTCVQAHYLGKSIRADISVVTKVDASLTSVNLLVANDDRKMVTIYNNSTASLFIKYGTTASASSFSLKIGAGDYLEFPYPCYIGQIDGFWDALNGNAMITEID
jgi:hypothetical protein